MNTQLPEEVRVGTFDYLTQRWRKKVVKRTVLDKRWHSGFQAEQGAITYNNEKVNVYRRNEQRYWTMFLDEVM